MKSLTSKFKKPIKNGQAMLELMLTLPIFLALVFGVIEISRLIFFYSSIFSASREAARYAAASGLSPNGVAFYRDCAGIRASAKSTSFGTTLSDSDISIYYDQGPDSNGDSVSIGNCGSYSSDLALGDRVVVTVSKQFEFIVPLFDFNAIPVSSTTSKTLITRLDILSTPPNTNTPRPTFTKTITLTPTSTDTLTPTSMYSSTPSNTPTITLTPTITSTPTITLNADNHLNTNDYFDADKYSACDDDLYSFSPRLLIHLHLPKRIRLLKQQHPLRHIHQLCQHLVPPGQPVISGVKIGILNLISGFQIFQNGINQKRYLTGFEIRWTGSAKLNKVTLAGTTIWGGTGFANSSPTSVTLSPPGAQFGNWDYKQIRLYFDRGINLSDVYYVKYFLTENCTKVIGSIP